MASTLEKNPLFLLSFCTLIMTSIFIKVLSETHDHDDQSHSVSNTLIRMELLHREYSPKSPFFSPSKTHWQRTITALKRSSKHRHKQAQSKLFPSGGEYLINISLGTPPKSIIAIADTGSDLIWTQCQPCQQCFKQRGSLFDSKASSSYKPLGCGKICSSFGGDYSCEARTRLCRYNFTYADGSFSVGNVAGETFELFSSSGDGSVVFKGVRFGCGFRNGGVWSGIESGIVGLGSGGLSLVSQMGQGRFSYCLVPMSSFRNPEHVSSKIVFGGTGLAGNDSVVSTPMLVNDADNYYYLYLKSVSVGRKRFKLKKPHTHKKGNIIVDSGTMLTFLPTRIYRAMEKQMRRKVRHLNVTEDPSGIMRLCYRTRGDVAEAPPVTFHFDGGADVRLRNKNVFLRTGDDVACFAFVATDDVLVFGNVAQMDFLIQYDLKHKVLLFKPTDCTRYN